MTLTHKEILDILISVLKEIQENVVDEPEPIDEKTVPIGDLCDFDSLASVEATVDVFNALGFKDNPPFPSIFIGKDNKALSLRQVADYIIKLKIN